MPERQPPAGVEGDPDADEEFLRPETIPTDVERGWEDTDGTAGEAPTG